MLMSIATPSHCAMVCQHGWIDVCSSRDITVGVLSKVCSDVAIEPPLQPLSGIVITPKTANQQDDPRADIYAHGFWRW